MAQIFARISDFDVLCQICAVFHPENKNWYELYYLIIHICLKTSLNHSLELTHEPSAGGGVLSVILFSM